MCPLQMRLMLVTYPNRFPTHQYHKNKYNNRTFISSTTTMPKKRLLLAVLAMEATGYHSPSRSNSHVASAFLKPKEASKRNRPKYDLGLGKNPPVTSMKKSLPQPTSTFEAARFWMIPEDVNTYPSPIAKLTKPKRPPQVIPHRMARDAVVISGNREATTATIRANAGAIEMNTLWVEMLIHEQRKRLIPAPTTL